jgi:hypothetical protein
LMPSGVLRKRDDQEARNSEARFSDRKESPRCIDVMKRACLEATQQDAESRT